MRFSFFQLRAYPYACVHEGQHQPVDRWPFSEISMAPIALPPEPPLNQPPAFSRSAADLQITDQGPGHALTNHYPGPHQAINSQPGPSFSPKSLIPPGQLSSQNSVDFSRPNLTQLPPLPPATKKASEPDSIVHGYEIYSSIQGIERHVTCFSFFIP